MSVEENVNLLMRWFREVWNEGRVETVYELLDENFRGWGQDQPGIVIRGPQEFVTFYNRLHGAFPDMRVTVEDTIAAEDKVVLRWLAEMTHAGDHLGIPVTNKRVRVTGISIARITNGKIMEGWDNWDQLALMQQLSFSAAARA
jgi:steroid delta-isomerase-like uncharacterized protein